MTSITKQYVTKSGKFIDVYDDVFDYNDIFTFYMKMVQSKFLCTGSDGKGFTNRNGQIFAQYDHADLLDIGFLSNDAMKSFYDKYDLYGRNLKQVRVNLSTPAEYNNIHTDQDGVTLLYYANTEWNVDWGGHTLFMNENLSDAEMTCLYKTGRVVVFDGSIPHMIMTPSIACPVNRFTLAFQFASR